MCEVWIEVVGFVWCDVVLVVGVLMCLFCEFGFVLFFGV